MEKRNLEEIKNIYTHDGCFHLDDVMCTAFIKTFNPNITVYRVSEITDEIASNPANLVFDIGLGQYDHHQKDRKYNKFGDPYSAFGLLWEDYGRDYLAKNNFENIEKAFQLFVEMYTSKVDRGDNKGYQNVPKFHDNTIIKLCNAKWYEMKADATYQTKQFNKAVIIAIQLLENWTREVYEKIEYTIREATLLYEAIQQSNNGVIVLQESIPWRNFILSPLFGDIKIVITKNERGGYNVISTNTDYLKIKPNQYLNFVHPSKFMGVADTLPNAINAANMIVDSAKF